MCRFNLFADIHSALLHVWRFILYSENKCIEDETLRQWVLENHKIADIMRMYEHKFNVTIR